MSSFLNKLKEKLSTSSAKDHSTSYPPLANIQSHRSSPRPSRDETDILLIESDPTCCLQAVTALTEVGFWVHAASSPEQGLVILNDHHIDLILVNGDANESKTTQLIRQIRTHTRSELARTPIIASSTSQMKIRERYLTAGVDDFLPTPFIAEDLQNIVFKWMATGPAFDDPNEIFEVYLTIMPNYIDRIKLGFQNRNWKMVSEAAHSVKSSSANIGAFRLGRLAELLEHQANQLLKDPKAEPMKQTIVITLDSEYEAVKLLLGRQLNRANNGQLADDYPFRGLN